MQVNFVIKVTEGSHRNDLFPFLVNLNVTLNERSENVSTS